MEIVLKPPKSNEASNLTARFRQSKWLTAVNTTCHRTIFALCSSRTSSRPTTTVNSRVRRCVIDRRITQGTRSEAGQRYHRRMWTAIATCGKQGRSFFQFLHESISAGPLGRRAAPAAAGVSGNPFRAAEWGDNCRQPWDLLGRCAVGD